jgi:hypothetical protein
VKVPVPTKPAAKPAAFRSATEDFEAASTIVKALDPLPPASRERVLRVAAILLGMDEKERP